MAQGTRGRWVRAAVFGFGVMASTSLVGCMNWDKPKDTKATAAPKPGLPGTPTLPPGGAAANTKMQWQPPSTNQYAGPGGNLQNSGFGTAGAPPRNGANGLTTSVPGQNFNNFAPGAPGQIGSPALPGVQPAGGFAPGAPVGAITPAGGATASYPPPNLTDFGPIPPAAPNSNNEFAQGVPTPVAPPSNFGPLAPVAPSPPVSPIAPGVGVFGSR